MNEMTFKGFMNAIKHIELPTDEEIEKENPYYYSEWRAVYDGGAKWMRDKIQGGNK